MLPAVYIACRLITCHAIHLLVTMEVISVWGHRTAVLNCLLVQATPPLGHLQDLGHLQHLGSSLCLVSR